MSKPLRVVAGSCKCGKEVMQRIEAYKKEGWLVCPDCDQPVYNIVELDITLEKKPNK